jgi:hypothetical protein
VLGSEIKIQLNKVKTSAWMKAIRTSKSVRKNCEGNRDDLEERIEHEHENEERENREVPCEHIREYSETQDERSDENPHELEQRDEKSDRYRGFFGIKVFEEALHSNWFHPDDENEHEDYNGESTRYTDIARRRFENGNQPEKIDGENENGSHFFPSSFPITG